MKSTVSSEKLKAGNEQAFADFYKGYFSLFLSFALKFTDERETARDIVQDVFMDYLKRRDSFNELIQIKVFFYRSIRNKALNLLARQKTRDKFISSASSPERETTEYFLNTIIREETAFILYQEMEKISPTGRLILEKAMDGKSNEEIAAELSISINTVKTHKARAYALLRRQLSNLRLILSIFSAF